MDRSLHSNPRTCGWNKYDASNGDGGCIVQCATCRFFSHTSCALFYLNRVSFRRKKKEDKKEDVAPKKSTPKEDKVSNRLIGIVSVEPVTTEERPTHPCLFPPAFFKRISFEAPDS